jgi:hypothetical protein
MPDSSVKEYEASLLLSHIAAIAHQAIRELRRRQNDHSLYSWDEINWRVKQKTVDSVRFILKAEDAPAKNPLKLSKAESRLFRSTVRSLAPFIVS